MKQVPTPQARQQFVGDGQTLTPVAHQMLLGIVAAVRELQEENEALKARVEALEG